MPDSEKIKLEIHIGDQPITLSVEASKREEVRKLEDEMSHLFKKWRQEFPKKDDRELLAMIAYQYASYYKELTQRYLDASSLAHQCDIALENIIEAEK